MANAQVAVLTSVRKIQGKTAKTLAELRAAVAHTGLARAASTVAAPQHQPPWAPRGLAPRDCQSSGQGIARRQRRRRLPVRILLS